MVELKETTFSDSLGSYLMETVKQLELDDWHIVFRNEADLGTDPNGGVVLGVCHANARYKQASIYLTKDTDNQTIVHELVHILTANTSQAAERIVGMLPENLREVAWEIFCDGLEPDVERLTTLLRSIISHEAEDIHD